MPNKGDKLYMVVDDKLKAYTFQRVRVENGTTYWEATLGGFMQSRPYLAGMHSFTPLEAWQRYQSTADAAVKEAERHITLAEEQLHKARLYLQERLRLQTYAADQLKELTPKE